jgi:outer membrane lipoprotein-sorting protein
MLAKERFYKYRSMKRKIFIIVLFFFIFSNNLSANTKSKIIENINNIESLKFNFTQLSLDSEESGLCFLKRPHFLKCSYNDKKQKNIIINKKTLVILHKRYDKSYFYPVSKSYFVEILDKKKFINLVQLGKLRLDQNEIELIFYTEKKGEIIFYFDKVKFDLLGWRVRDINNNSTNFRISNLVKNEEFDQKIFSIPSIN